MRVRDVGLLSLLFLDIGIIIWFTVKLGVKALGIYMGMFFLSVIVSGIILVSLDRYVLKIGVSDEKYWQTKYLRTGCKPNYYKLFYLPVVIIMGLFIAFKSAFIGGIMTGFIVNLLWLLYYPEFLHMIMMFNEAVNNNLESWIAKRGWGK